MNLAVWATGLLGVVGLAYIAVTEAVGQHRRARRVEDALRTRAELGIDDLNRYLAEEADQ